MSILRFSIPFDDRLSSAIWGFCEEACEGLPIDLTSQEYLPIYVNIQRNLKRSLLVSGTFNRSIASTLSGPGFIPSALITSPKKVIELVQNTPFSWLRRKLFWHRTCRTRSNRVLCSSKVLPQTIIHRRYHGCHVLEHQVDSLMKDLWGRQNPKWQL